MFDEQRFLDKMTALERRHEELTALLGDPEVIGRRGEFQKLSREHSELAALVAAWHGYKKLRDDLEQARQLIGAPDSDAEMRDLAREEARELEAQLAAAERWMRASGSTKEHWVFGASGYPMSHGEVAQERTLWRVLAWATNQPPVRGMIVGAAGDYDRMVGLRAPDGRLRRAAYSLARAIRRLRENVEVGGG